MPRRTKQQKPITDAELEQLDERFLRSEMAVGLNSYGIYPERHDVRTNTQSYGRITERQHTSSTEWNYTVIGKEIFEEEKNYASAAYRRLNVATKKYVTSIQNQPAWAFWTDKGLEELKSSRAATEVEGQVETLAWYAKDTKFFDGVEDAAFNELQPYVDEVFEYISGFFSDWKPINLDNVEGWKPKMNFNRNSGHPFYMPISEERFSSVDWPNFKDYLVKLVKSVNRDALEVLMGEAPNTVKNANQRIYALFHRPPDRVIHGVRLLLKPLGACMTANTTVNMRTSEVAWTSIDSMRTEFSKALADAVGVSADDLKKFDRSLHSMWFKLIYERYWESKLFDQMPELRMLCGALLFEMTQDAYLQLAATRRMLMRAGLWSGHPLTQFVGSIIHLVIYAFWKDRFSMEPSLQKVLSDDGIQVYNDMEQSELKRLLDDDCGPMLERLGMLLHPEKTVTCDPQPEYRVGVLMGEEIMGHDMPFFVKQKFQRNAAAAHGNPIGVNRSMIQVERTPTDTALAGAADKHLAGVQQLTLGGKAPTRVYDLARLVDVLASSGIANPLIEHQIRFVQEGWPGFEENGLDILENKLSAEWREGTTHYAGGTLDSGISRKVIVEALLSTDTKDKFWDELDFLL
jgi:hypothetical protein